MWGVIEIYKVLALRQKKIQENILELPDTNSASFNFYLCDKKSDIYV